MIFGTLHKLKFQTSLNIFFKKVSWARLLRVEAWVPRETDSVMEISTLGAAGEVKGPEWGCDTVTAKVSAHLGETLELGYH